MIVFFDVSLINEIGVELEKKAYYSFEEEIKCSLGRAFSRDLFLLPETIKEKVMISARDNSERKTPNRPGICIVTAKMCFICAVR